MSVKINITSNIVAAIAEFEQLPRNEVFAASRVAINRALITGRTTASKTLRERLNIKAAKVKDKVKIEKAQGGRLSNLHGNIVIDTEALPLLDFVRGNKNTIKQKGIKISRRRKLKVEIQKGKKFVMPGGFIQKVKSKQVFKRSPNTGKLFKQSAPSIAEWLARKEFEKKIIDSMMASFEKNLSNQLAWRMEKMAARIADSKMVPIK